MRIEMIVWFCGIGLIVLGVILSEVFLAGYKKGIQYMVDFFKLIYEKEQRREKDE